MKTFKTFLREDEYLNKAGDRFLWNPDDISVGTNTQVEESIMEKSEAHEEWLGSDDHAAKFPDMGDETTNHISKTKELYKSVKYGLLTKQSEALHHYIGSGYREMNELNRTGKIDKEWQLGSNTTEQIEGHSKNLDSAIKKHTTDKSIHVWRGMGEKGPEHLKLKEGDTFHDKGFVSTTTHPMIAKRFSIVPFTEGKELHVFHIKVPKGSNVIHPLSHNTSAARTEDEVILPRNSKFRYDGRTEHHEPKLFHGQRDKKIIVHHITHIPGDE